MNIFVTDPDPVACAQMLDDVRLNKMIVESAQMLSTTMWFAGRDARAERIYRPISNPHHPACKWSRLSLANYNWLLEHAEAMLVERRHRGWVWRHETEPVIARLRALASAPVFPLTGLTPFHNSSAHKHISDVHLAYRETMREKWKVDVATQRIPLSWTVRGQPAWRDQDGT